MPITLEKLFSKTATVSFPYEGETVNVTWAPARYTGQMQDRADEIQEVIDESSGTASVALDRARIAEEAAAALPDVDGTPSPEKQAALEAAAELRTQAKGATFGLSRKIVGGIRENLAKLLVTWDVLGIDGKPIPTDEDTLRGLPDEFVIAVFQSVTGENQMDPQKAPDSDKPSLTETSSAPNPAGIPTSKPRGRSTSRPSSSMNGQSAPATIQSGAPGA